jgi:hypothetical protein
MKTQIITGRTKGWLCCCVLGDLPSLSLSHAKDYSQIIQDEIETM